MNNRKRSKSERRNLDNHYSIFAYYRSLDSTKDKRFVALPHSLINHQSFTSLSDKSKLLYLYMTDYSQGKQEFSYPRRIYKNLMCNETFKTSREELKEHGFITIMSEGGLFNNEAQYKFIADWKNFKPKVKQKRKTKIQEYKN